MKREELLHIFPQLFRPFFELIADQADELQEIRLCINQPLRILLAGQEYFVREDGRLSQNSQDGKILGSFELEGFFQYICRYSVYAFEDEIRQGFLTIPGGHRVGMTGQIILDDENHIRNMKYIRCFNIRIAHQILGVADELLPSVYENGYVQSTLLISPPGCGKTTMLRDLIRQISDGNTCGKGVQTCVVDERSELAGCFQGIPQNDLGIRTAVMDACPKQIGMLSVLRSMSPAVIAVDEIGNDGDLKMLELAKKSGTRVIATMHGTDIHEIERMGWCRERLDAVFSCYVVLERRKNCCKIAKIYRNGILLCND